MAATHQVFMCATRGCFTRMGRKGRGAERSRGGRERREGKGAERLEARGVQRWTARTRERHCAMSLVGAKDECLRVLISREVIAVEGDAVV